MALQSNALLTVQEALDYIKATDRNPSTNPDASLLESLINRASDFVESYTGGPVINKTVTVALDGNGDDELLVSPYPIQSITSATMDGVNITANVDFYPEGSVFLKDGSVFTVGRKNVSITYVAGYGANTSAIPQDVRQAALLIVQFWYKRDVLDYSETFGQSEIIVGQWRFPSTALKMLDPYRRYKAAVV